MRLKVYSVEKGNEIPNVLVMEKSGNYPDIDSLNSPEKICFAMNSLFKANVKTEEHMWMIAVDTKLKPIGFFEISHGAINYSICNPREIFMRLCLCGAY